MFEVVAETELGELGIKIYLPPEENISPFRMLTE